jgi:hypothetical protein
MIQNRFDEVSSKEDYHKEDGLWPQEFCLAGSDFNCTL